MFNSTLTEDNAFLCPVDGAIMITGSLWLCSSVDSILEYVRVHMLENSAAEWSLSFPWMNYFVKSGFPFV